MAKEMYLSEVISLDNLVSLGKREGLKYFKKANEQFSVQDLCKHWQISSATFYSKYAPQIGYKTKSKSKLKSKEIHDNINEKETTTKIKKMTKVNTTKKDKVLNEKTKEIIKSDNIVMPMVSMQGIPKIFEEKTNDSIIGKDVTTMVTDENISKVCTSVNELEEHSENTLEETMKMEQIFKMNNCSDLNKMKEILNTVNALFNNSSVYDVELRMIEK